MPPLPTAPRHARRLAACVVAGALLVLSALYLIPTPDTRPPPAPAAPRAAAEPPGPPWRYGAPDARFTAVLYADLECPYCRDYLPALRSWVDRHPDVRLEWHHLPLPDHEPAASALAAAAECVGEQAGQVAYWETIAWIYQHTRGDGLGLPDGLAPPASGPGLRACLDSGRPQAIVRRQAEEGLRGGIAATPTLSLRDDVSGRSLLLQGPVEDDGLLSAIDLLSSSEHATTQDATAPLAADPLGDLPQ